MYFDIRLFLGIENGGYILIELVDIAEEREEEVSNLLDWAVKDL